MQHSIEQTRAFIRTSLTGIYPEGEINALIRVILEEIGGLEPYQILLGKDREISDTLFHRIHEVVDRLHEMEPLQYILGHSVFSAEWNWKVSPAVLIPRPETEAGGKDRRAFPRNEKPHTRHRHRQRMHRHRAQPSAF